MTLEQDSWLNGIDKGQSILSDIQFRTKNISDRLYSVYQDGLAREIENISEKCKEAYSLIEKGINKNLTEDLKTSREHTGLLLKATLSGCLSNKKETIKQ